MATIARERAAAIVEALCSVTVDRRPGSAGNDEAVDYVGRAMADAGWSVTTPEFDCLDWVGGDGSIRVAGQQIPITPSPYGLGVDATGPIRVLGSVEDLRTADLGGSVAVVNGDLVAEPMTPKAFPFYGSDEHTEIIHLLEARRPAVVVAVTGKHPELCGALDPFPWIEDGDFEIPAASIRPADADVLLASEGRSAAVEIDARRIPSRARNVVARRGPAGPRLTVCAHIDTKPGTPGAVDNATGVAALMLLADALGRHEELPIGVELLAVNGEDHFAGPGEVAWLAANEGRLDDIELFINIDGAGYRRGATAYSFYNVDDAIAAGARGVFRDRPDLVEGPPWFQSDHAIFAMQGRPALAFTTEFVQEMLAELFHSEHDTIDQVDPDLIVSLAGALCDLVVGWPPR